MWPAVRRNAAVRSDDLQTLIDVLTGVVSAGDRVQLIQYNNSSNYALDVRNADTTNSYGLRVRDAADANLLLVYKDNITVGANVTVGASLTVDGLDLSAHAHTGAAGHGVQVAHTSLTTIGTNTHAQIDTHIATAHVNTFNGRSGAVVPETNDYTWAQINKTTSDIADITTRAHASLTGVTSDQHHAAVTLASDADVLLGLSTQQLTLDSQTANTVLSGPASGAAADPTFRALVQADLPTISAVKVAHSANQATTTGNWVTLAFDTEEYDTDAMHETSSNNSRITIATAGKYRITGLATFASNATGIRYIRILKNGATNIAQNNKAAVNGDTTDLLVAITDDLAATDYVELQVVQTSGGDLNAIVVAGRAPLFMAERLSP